MENVFTQHNIAVNHQNRLIHAVKRRNEVEMDMILNQYSGLTVLQRIDTKNYALKQSKAPGALLFWFFIFSFSTVLFVFIFGMYFFLLFVKKNSKYVNLIIIIIITQNVKYPFDEYHDCMYLNVDMVMTYYM